MDAWPELPAFLDRRAECPVDVKALLGSSGQRAWIVPTRRKGEDEMAKLGYAITDRAAPVEVNRKTDTKEGFAHVRNFSGMDEFERWYSPGVHTVVYASSNAKQTVVMLRIKGDDGPVAAAGSVAQPLPPPGTDRGAVVKGEPRRPRGEGKPYVDSKLVKAIKQAGYELTFVEGLMTFTNASAETVVFSLPVPPRMWGSAWTLSDGRRGEGAVSVLRAIGVKK